MTTVYDAMYDHVFHMLAIRAMVQSFAILVIAGAISKLAKSDSSAFRHSVWISALVAVLVCPIVSSLIERADSAGVRMGPIRTLSQMSQPISDSILAATEIDEPVKTRIRIRSNRDTRPDNSVEIPPNQDVAIASIPTDQPTSTSWLRIPEIELAKVVRTLTIVWATGSLIALGYLAFGLASLQRFRNRAIACDDPEVIEILAQACASVGSKCRPAIAITRDSNSPVAFGIFRPVILLPHKLIESADRTRLRQILVHEVAHLARRDPLIGLMQQVAVALYWPNPLVHIMSRQLSRTREEICDNFVLLQGERASYARMLIDLAESLQKSRGPIVAELLPRRWHVAQRISGLVDNDRNLEVRMKPVNLCVLALIAISIGIPISAISTAREQDPAQEPTRPIAVGAIPAKDPNPNPIAKNEIGGFVVDQEGKPIAGAIVDAYSWVPGHVTRTNQDGSFRLNVEVFGYLVEPEVEMRVTKPGYCPKTFAKVKTGTTVPNIVLKDNTWLEGTVFDRTGKPVADATVRARTPAMRDGREIGSYWTETKSGADGRYVLHIEPAEIEIHSTVKGSGVFISPSVRLNEGQTMRVDVKLRSGGTLRAKVVDSKSGEPVAGLRMMKWLQNRTFEFEGQSGKDGIISITEIPPSIVDFNIEALGYARWWSEESHSVWNRKSTDLNDPRYRKWQRNFDGLNFEIGEGTKEVTIFVEKEVTIRGTVLDPDGKHVAGATVAPALTGSGNSLTGDTRFSVKSDESGNYEMKLPASGERVYNLVVHDGDYMTWRNWANGVSRTITTKPGEVLENFDISLTRPASVRGRVLDTSGKPVVNREVRTSAEDTMENRYYDPTTKTDAEGRFELKFVRPGTHFVQLHPFYLTAKDAPEGTSHTIHVKAGDSVEGIQFVPPIEFEPRQ